MSNALNGASRPRVWFITGASKGLGLEIARAALDNGAAVVATARDPRQIAGALAAPARRLLALTLDVTDEQQVMAAVAAAVAHFGRIDVLVNNAGRGLLGAVEEASDAEARAVFDINLFGLLTVTRAVLPIMRRQRSGRIINIGSIGGFRASAGWGIYNATKFAVEGISEALSQELRPLGIAVTVIEPGFVRTDFLDGSSLRRTAQLLDDYAATAGVTRDRAETINHAQPGDPARAGLAIYTAATAAEPPTRLQLGSDSVAAVEEKLAHVADELNRWRALSVSIDHTSAQHVG